MIVAIELNTIIYIIISCPIIFFLMVLSYRLAEKVWDTIKVKFNRKIVEENKRIVMENIKASNELIKTQRELKEELEDTKKGMRELYSEAKELLEE